MIVPRTQISVDPDKITKVEIICLDGVTAEVRIHLADAASPEVYTFLDKAAAIDFYREVWLLRSGKTLEDGQIEEIMAEASSQ
jgi:hypothetical protein